MSMSACFSHTDEICYSDASGNNWRFWIIFLFQRSKSRRTSSIILPSDLFFSSLYPRPATQTKRTYLHRLAVCITIIHRLHNPHVGCLISPPRYPSTSPVHDVSRFHLDLLQQSVPQRIKQVNVANSISSFLDNYISEDDKWDSWTQSYLAQLTK